MTCHLRLEHVMKPEAADEIDDFYHQIKRVRELSGLHYPSDRKVSEYLFKAFNIYTAKNAISL